MKKVVYLALFTGLFWLSGCADRSAEEVAQATAVPTAVVTEIPAATATSAPTDTAVPTEAPTETATAVPTDTPEPTATNTATPTEAPTETPTTAPTATAVPATSTTAPPAPVAAPPPAPAPAGPNLLVNPGFEYGVEGWAQASTNSLLDAGSVPQFVHSGQRSFLFPPGYGSPRISQRVTNNIASGATYRAGAWFKIWSSSEDDRSVSVNPANVFGRICINTNGDDEATLDTTICSSWVQPFDVWQFISVDAVSTNTQITVILQVTLNNTNGAAHIQPIWDDVTLGTAPVSATATPPPAAGPVRPNPVAFDPTALRDSMNSVRSTIEQEGGLLDRLYNGQGGTCAEFQGYYDDAIRSATYSGVPEDWAGIYNDYIFAVEHFLATNENINSLCDNGGGGISSLNYGAARTGINDSLNRLIPAIEAANAKIGG